jgi:hypothetical protein
MIAVAASLFAMAAYPQDATQAPAADESIVASLSPPENGLPCTEAARQTTVSFDFARPDFEIKQISLYVDGHGVAKDSIEQKWPRVTLVHGLHPGRNTVEIVATGDRNRSAARRLTVLIGETPKSGDVAPAVVNCNAATSMVSEGPEVVSDESAGAESEPQLVEEAPPIERTEVVERTVYVDQPVYVYHTEPFYPVWPVFVPIIPVVIGWFPPPPPPPVAYGVWVPHPYCPPPAVVYNPAPPPHRYPPPPVNYRPPPHEPQPVSNMYRTPRPITQTPWTGTQTPQPGWHSPSMSGPSRSFGDSRTVPYEHHYSTGQMPGQSSESWSAQSHPQQPHQPVRPNPPQYRQPPPSGYNGSTQQWRSPPQQQPQMRSPPQQPQMRTQPQQPQPSPQRQSWNPGMQTTHTYRAPPVHEMQVHESPAMQHSAPRPMAPPRPFTGPAAPMARPMPDHGFRAPPAQRGGGEFRRDWQQHQR